MDSIHRLPTCVAVIGTGTANRDLEVSTGWEIAWSLRSCEVPGIHLYWATKPRAFPNSNFVATSTRADRETRRVFEHSRTKEPIWEFLAWETSGNYPCANICRRDESNFICWPEPRGGLLPTRAPGRVYLSRVFES